MNDVGVGYNFLVVDVVESFFDWIVWLNIVGFFGRCEKFVFYRGVVVC